MLDLLHRAEAQLPTLLREAGCWNSIYIDYHPPFVERLWCEIDDGYRLYLHRIHPCAREDALMHPHPWPSAMRIVSGAYEMGVGSSESSVAPPLTCTLILRKGSEYEMVEPHGWHYVRPLVEPSLSVMVTGKPWGRESPKSTKQLGTLSTSVVSEMLSLFQAEYTQTKSRQK
jgi:hypothetical protein